MGGALIMSENHEDEKDVQQLFGRILGLFMKNETFNDKIASVVAGSLPDNGRKRKEEIVADKIMVAFMSFAQSACKEGKQKHYEAMQDADLIREVEDHITNVFKYLRKNPDQREK
jgi:hypothetical protein